VDGSCEHYNETLGFIKGGCFFISWATVYQEFI